MITSDDIEFEPPKEKIYSLTNSIVMLIAGLTAPQIEIWQGAWADVAARLLKDTSWMRVREAAEIVAKRTIQFTTERQLRTVLEPRGLDFHTLIGRQREFRKDFLEQVQYEMGLCRPTVSTLVAGLDPHGGHIYEIDKWGDMVCHDAAGFAAIGGGQRHADSQFMFSKHSARRPYLEAVYLTYAAKKRAESAPGVGVDTDMFYITELGRGRSVPDVVLDVLETAYKEELREAKEANARALKFLPEVMAEAEAAIREKNQTEQLADPEKPSTPREQGAAEALNPEAPPNPQSPRDGQ